MSDSSRIITSLLDSDIFLGREGQSKLEYVFNYFDDGPKRQLERFNKFQDPNGAKIDSPIQVLEKLFISEYQYTDSRGEIESLPRSLAILGKQPGKLAPKLNKLEEFRKKYYSNSLYGKELWNQLIDFAEDYVIQAHIIGQEQQTVEDLQTLSKGADEMFVLGQILGLNQGIKTSSSDFIKQINTFERAIYNITKDPNDIVDLIKFIFNKDYRQQVINTYESVKNSFNIYDVVSSVPHFMGYLQTLAVALKEAQQSFKFRSAKNLSVQLSERLGYKREDRISRGVQNYVGDYMRKEWMLSEEIQVVIPKGNKAFDNHGNQYTLSEDTPIKLGTMWGDATFRMFVENQVIPNLKRGYIKGNSGVTLPIISKNKFIQDLSYDINTKTVSKNPTIVYTLPINMLPRTDQEKAILNRYKSEFNKLREYSYQYQTTSYDSDGNLVMQEQSISLIDLFTYYSMIAHNWKLGEKSLVPILENFQNSEKISSFHRFETKLDKSGKYLDLNQSSDLFYQILPYVIPFDSPYSSFTEYLWYKNPVTKKYQIMERLSKSSNNYDEEDYEMMEQLMDQGDYEDYDDSYDKDTIGDYKFVPLDVDTNYFTTTRIEDNIRTEEFWYKETENLKEGDDGSRYIGISYDVDTEKVIRITSNFATEIELDKVPFTKVNGEKVINIDSIKDKIKSDKNPCQYV